MREVLQWLATLTPKRLLVAFWLTAVLLASASTINALSGMASAALLLIYCGYPYAVILGLPPGVVRPAITRWCRPWFVVLLVLAVAIAILTPLLPESGYQTPQSPSTPREWFEVAMAIVANVAVFSPFFLGSAALNDARWSLGQRVLGDSIPNFLALFFWPYGGGVYVQRRIREVLHVA